MADTEWRKIYGMDWYKGFYGQVIYRRFAYMDGLSSSDRLWEAAFCGKMLGYFTCSDDGKRAVEDAYYGRSPERRA